MNKTIRCGVSLFLFFLIFFLVIDSSKEISIAGESSAPDNMVLIPEGKFLSGEMKKEVDLKAFYIDKTEVTNEEFKKFQSGHVYPPQEGKFPAREISWFDAADYCKWAGKRLPTEDEWEKAARGTDGRRYPWGPKFEPKRANSSDMGGKAAAVGSFPTGASPYGVLDMAGNVWEWTDSWYGDDKKYKAVRGGSYFEPGEDMSQVTKRLKSIPDDTHEYIGFRCAKSPEK
jgi:iron(II)-dependent oxidoreductase